jgi:hypothetical protein
MASNAALLRRCHGLALELGHFWTFDDHVHDYAMTSTVSHHLASRSPSMDSHIALSLLL